MLCTIRRITATIFSRNLDTDLRQGSSVRLLSQVRRMNSQQQPSVSVKFLTQDEAINLDQELFNEYAFSVDQLMELAGLSVATAIAKCYPNDKYDKPVICCGPGNNGGDGLVAARHLRLFGYSPLVICPKAGRAQIYQNLLTQCRKFHITILDNVPNRPIQDLGNLIVDAIFGFSFKPPNRNHDFANLLTQMDQMSKVSPLVSIDIPSGWHVENGCASIDEDQAGIESNLRIPALQPDCLISLTAPKLCAKHFKGRYHFLGGRFCPKTIEEKYRLNLPGYPSTEVVTQLH